MPFINVKIVKQQVSPKQKQDLIEGLTALVVNEMNRSRELTNIVIDEIDASSWAIGGKTIDPAGKKVAFVNIKVSRGTTNDQEMNRVIEKTRVLLSALQGEQAGENYVIVDELNPGGWGFDGISMIERAKKEA